MVLLCEGKRKEISKGFRETTNNRMELMAVIAGLSILKVKCNVTIYSDSKYVVDAINKGWLRNWHKKVGGSTQINRFLMLTFGRNCLNY